MKYVDVRLRMPARHLGLFVTEHCPSYAQVLGMDALVEDKPEDEPLTNGHRESKKGTADAAVQKYLTKRGAALPSQIISGLKNSHKSKAVSSALYRLFKKGQLTKQEDGTYALAH